MSTKPTAEFAQLLAQVMASYGKPLPDAVIVRSWWTSLAPFPGQVVREAFSAYALEKPDFAPVPNSIAARCRLLDGRPGVEEAWAIALASRCEADTVVWTSECAEAFGACRAVLELGDEIGARMSFKDAYLRLVARSRAANEPASWQVSIGWDETRRDAAVKRAITAGLLPAPEVPEVPLLEAPEGQSADDRAREQLAKVKQLLVEGAEAKQRALDAASDFRIKAEEATTREIADKVDGYMRGAP